MFEGSKFVRLLTFLYALQSVNMKHILSTASILLLGLMALISGAQADGNLRGLAKHLEEPDKQGAAPLDLEVTEASSRNNDLDMIDDTEGTSFSSNFSRRRRRTKGMAAGGLAINDKNCRKYGKKCSCLASKKDFAEPPSWVGLKNNCNGPRLFHIKYFQYKNDDTIKGPVKVTRIQNQLSIRQPSVVDDLGVDCIKVKHCSLENNKDCTAWKNVQL